MQSQQSRKKKKNNSLSSGLMINRKTTSSLLTGCRLGSTRVCSTHFHTCGQVLTGRFPRNQKITSVVENCWGSFAMDATCETSPAISSVFLKVSFDSTSATSIDAHPPWRMLSQVAACSSLCLQLANPLEGPISKYKTPGIRDLDTHYNP